MSDQFMKLPNQPLTCVLAEFRYSQILKIDNHIPDFQESIRQTYPLINRADQQTVQVSGQGINLSNASQWVFTSQDRRSAVIVSSDRIAFATSNYDRFPEFSEQCLSLLSQFKEVVKPSLLLRIGLRYIDLIPFKGSTKPAEIVSQQFIPAKEMTDLGMKNNYHRTELSLKTSEGVLTVRSLMGQHGLVVMPDLSPALPIKLDKQGDRNVVSLLLDFDHTWIAEDSDVSFDLNVAKQCLGSLHKTTRQAFWNATTEYARSELWM